MARPATGNSAKAPASISMRPQRRSRTRFRMYSYVTRELPALIARTFKADVARSGLFGHSMGGHGALTIALQQSRASIARVSAFAPIVAPSQVPWGQKALPRYLGEDRECWKRYDSVELIRDGTALRRHDPDRPGRCRCISRQPAADRELLREACARSRPGAGAAPATRLRPQLLVHPVVHRRSSAPSRQRTEPPEQRCVALPSVSAAITHIVMSASKTISSALIAYLDDAHAGPARRAVVIDNSCTRAVACNSPSAFFR